MASNNDLETLKSLLSPAELITPDHDMYLEESIVWAQQAYQHPTLIVRPTSLESLSKAVKFLAESSLDWQVKTGGAGNASAEDVVLSTRAFNGLTFDRENEIVELGAGALWSEYYAAMERIAPEYTGEISLELVPCRYTDDRSRGVSNAIHRRSWIYHRWGFQLAVW